MGIRTASDCYGSAWYYRDADLRCIFYDWQYNLYSTLDYFFRPIRWLSGGWYYPVVSRYRYGYYYFDRPLIYSSYRGGRWHQRRQNSLSPYYGMRPSRGGRGMRDRYEERDGRGNGFANRGGRSVNLGGNFSSRSVGQRNDFKQNNNGSIGLHHNDRSGNTTMSGRTGQVTTVEGTSRNSTSNTTQNNRGTFNRGYTGTNTATRLGNSRENVSRQSGASSQTSLSTANSSYSSSQTRSFGTGFSKRGSSQSVSPSRPSQSKSSSSRSSGGRSFGGKR